MDLFFGWIAQYGYPALFALLMLGIVGLPVPDETLLMFAGYMVFKQELSVFPTIAAAFLGSACGISLSYGLGRTVGTYLVGTLGHLIGVDGEQLERVRAWYGRRGKYTLLISYFVPGVRHVTAMVAGSAKLSPTVFAVYAYSGGVLWSVSFLAVGYFLGEQWTALSAGIHRALVAAAAVGLGGLAGWFLVMRKRERSR